MSHCQTLLPGGIRRQISPLVHLCIQQLPAGQSTPKIPTTGRSVDAFCLLDDFLQDGSNSVDLQSFVQRKKPDTV